MPHSHFSLFSFFERENLDRKLTIFLFPVSNRQRYLPKPIHQATKLRREMLDAANNKEENRRKHAPKGIDPEQLKPTAQRKLAIQKVES